MALPKDVGLSSIASASTATTAGTAKQQQSVPLLADNDLEDDAMATTQNIKKDPNDIAVENVDYTSSEENVVARELPESLKGLNAEDYAKLQRKATLKMDLQLLPSLVIMYIMNFLDRQNLASAKLAGIEKDLGLSPVQYKTTISILFVGYIIMQVPSNMILSKIKYPGSYICSAMALWGVISGCMGAAHNFTGLLVTRFLVGFVEAVFFPGALYFLSLFYNRKQYAFRAAILYSGSQFGNAFGGLFAIGIFKLDGAHGLAGWRWLFIVEGVLTVGLAIIFALTLPNSPKSVRFMTQAERDVVAFEYEKDQGQADNSAEITAKQGLVMALKDPKVWMLMGTLYCIFIASAVTNFFPSVVATLKFNRTTTLGLTAPPFLLSIITISAVGFHSDKKQERYLHIVLPLCVTLAANIIAVATTNTAARYIAMMLMPPSFYSASTVLLSWIAGSVNQPAAKRAAAIALINATVNTPNIWTSYLYFGAPRYLVAFLVNMAAAAGAIGLATVTMLYLKRQNNKLDQGRDTGKSGPTEAQKASGFRYIL
jgi:MFS family permease